jgi:hypothetical protein
MNAERDDANAALLSLLNEVNGANPLPGREARGQQKFQTNPLTTKDFRCRIPHAGFAA